MQAIRDYRQVALRVLLCCACLLVVRAAPGQEAAPALKFLATDPAADATLARQQSFYVRFEVASRTPVVVTVNALYRGEPVHSNMGTGGMVSIPAGGGIGVTHFFYWSEQPTRIDEVRLKVSDPGNTRQGKEFALPVHLTWVSQGAAPRELAPWVQEWRQAEEARHKAQYEQYEKRMAESGPSPAAFALIFLVLMCAIAAAGFGLPLWGALKWQGYWRIAAIGLGILPLLSLANIVVGVSRDRTSHNLAPLELGIWLIVAGGAMSVLLAARYFLRLKAKRAQAPANGDAGGGR